VFNFYQQNVSRRSSGTKADFAKYHRPRTLHRTPQRKRSCGRTRARPPLVNRFEKKAIDRCSARKLKRVEQARKKSADIYISVWYNLSTCTGRRPNSTYDERLESSKRERLLGRYRHSLQSTSYLSPETLSSVQKVGHETRGTV